jgi:hypothetical protein
LKGNPLLKQMHHVVNTQRGTNLKTRSENPNPEHVLAALIGCDLIMSS